MTPNLERYLAALRSGDYQQGQYVLRHGNCFCALGVAAEIFKTPDTPVYEDPETGEFFYGPDQCVSNAPHYVMAALDLRDNMGRTDPTLTLRGIASMNDRGMTFAQIADIIEENQDAYFFPAASVC